MMKGLTVRQQEVLELIGAHINIEGYPPTRQELARMMGCASPNAAEAHLRALEKKGAVVMFKGISRGIKIVEQVSQ